MIVKAALRALAVTAFLGAVLFPLAGTMHWLGGYLLLVAMATGGFAMEAWLITYAPDLYAERHNTKQTKSCSEQILLPLLHGLFFFWLLAMAWDVRLYGTGQMPVWVNLAGAAAVLVCFLGNILVFRANRYASAIVRIQDGQTVADQGPYKIVRHPMYGIAVFTYMTIPLTLGSWSGFFGVPVLILLLAIRTLFEERLLQRQLPGYGDYRRRVRYRFVPYVW